MNIEKKNEQREEMVSVQRHPSKTYQTSQEWQKEIRKIKEDPFNSFISILTPDVKANRKTIKKLKSPITSIPSVITRS